MKLRELRIGNYVLGNNYIACEVSKLSNDMGDKDIIIAWAIGTSPIGTAEPKPIPLTEEWLLKLGFIKKGNEINIQHWYLEQSSFYLNSYISEPHKYWLRYYHGRINKKIEYVHQLQNLYFSLTGEELTLKTT